MAKIEENSLIAAVTGMIGKQVVVKRRKGKPYLSGAPSTNPRRKPTPNQAVSDRRFEECVEYANMAKVYPEKIEFYTSTPGPGETIYHKAFTDAYKAPKVTAILAKGYQGREGDIIYINAHDNFKVVAVRVSIYNKEKELIEEGSAVPQEGDVWIYTATQNIKGEMIAVSAFDFPGNEGTASCMVS